MRFSLDLREVADVRAQYETHARGPRLPPARLFGRRRRRLAARVLPVLRRPAGPAHRPLAVRRRRGRGQAGALRRGQASSASRGSKHGERYTVTLRAGIPSVVKETLAKSAEFNIYVRDRKPFVRFSGKAYVLPRIGQRGIPVVSVNTTAVAIEIYRIGDRNLLNTVVGSDFQRKLDRYDISRLTEERGDQVWKGEMKVEQQLNADVTTAFPVDQAVGAMQPAST